jgi:release factor glutamine methyltransferase
MQNTIKYIQSELLGYYPENEIKSFGYLLVEKVTGFSRTQLIINSNYVFTETQFKAVEAYIGGLKNFVPIQYLLGETEFYGLQFCVNKAVLIPRPETEELVDWIVNDNNIKTELRILDIGTGSGCIAIALKSVFANANVDAFDISVEALQTANINAKNNGLDVNFVELNILDSNENLEKWDIIVSNPPYIPELEKADILPNVLNYEPHIALFVPDNDPLIFYRHIADFAKKHLFPNGKLYFEIHRDAGETTSNLLLDLGFTDVELRKDISGNNRMVKARYVNV